MKVLIMCLVRTQSQGRFLKEAIFHQVLNVRRSLAQKMEKTNNPDKKVHYALLCVQCPPLAFGKDTDQFLLC